MEDHPDFYWEDEMQSKAELYKKIWTYLAIPRRLKVWWWLELLQSPVVIARRLL